MQPVAHDDPVDRDTIGLGPFLACLPDELGIEAQFAHLEVFRIDLADEVKVYKAVIDRGHKRICARGDEAGIFVIAAGRVKDQEIILGAQSFDLPVKCRLRIMLKHFKHGHGQADATPRNRVAPVFEVTKQCPLA